MLRLKEIREQRGISQGQLGKAFGLSVSTISMYEAGKREPSLETVVKFADYFNVPVEYLIGQERSVSYSEHFRRNVAFVMETHDSADWEAWAENGGNYGRLERIVEGHSPLYLDDACEIADELRESIADLIKDPDAPPSEESPGEDDTTPRDDREREFIRLLRAADEVHRRLAEEILQAAVRKEQTAKTGN